MVVIDLAYWGPLLGIIFLGSILLAWVIGVMEQRFRQ